MPRTDEISATHRALPFASADVAVQDDASIPTAGAESTVHSANSPWEKEAAALEMVPSAYTHRTEKVEDSKRKVLKRHKIHGTHALYLLFRMESPA